jgi:hypothetical protein
LSLGLGDLDCVAGCRVEGLLACRVGHRVDSPLRRSWAFFFIASRLAVPCISVTYGYLEEASCHTGRLGLVEIKRHGQASSVNLPYSSMLQFGMPSVPWGLDLVGLALHVRVEG